MWIIDYIKEFFKPAFPFNKHKENGEIVVTVSSKCVLDIGYLTDYNEEEQTGIVIASGPDGKCYGTRDMSRWYGTGVKLASLDVWLNYTRKDDGGYRNYLYASEVCSLFGLPYWLDNYKEVER